MIYVLFSSQLYIIVLESMILVEATTFCYVEYPSCGEVFIQQQIIFYSFNL
jgi:hypothetical protein